MFDTNLLEITPEEYAGRLARTREAMKREGLDLLIVWSDCYRMAGVRWLANYRAFDGVIPYSTLLVVPLSGEPTLFATATLEDTAKASSPFKDVREIRGDLKPLLSQYAASGSVKRVGINGYRYLALETWNTIRDSFPEAIKIGSTSILDRLKSIKSEAEIRNMKVAGWLADVACEAVKNVARTGMTERELTRHAYSEMFLKGADGIAFDLFVQTGENSANFYLQRPTDRKLQDGDIVMMDMGCRYNGYASDNARAAGYGNISKEAQRALDVSLEAFEAGMKIIKPGITGADASRAASEVLARHGYLKKSQVLRCGHGTGMDPEEEYPSLMPNSNDVLEENQSLCFAVTLLVPGVAGVRQEDPVIVRKDGAESLSNYPYRNNWPSA
jgi:Xaa-Pro aminopeptidase